MSSDNYIDYPSMTRQREANIQQGLVAKADDVNAEFNNVVTTYNRLVGLLQGEFGGNGRIYELVDTAVAAANQAKTDAANAVKKTGDSMQGQLTTQLEPTSPYSMVNKQYVDNTMQTTVGPVSTLSNSNKERLDNLDATNVKLSNGNFSSNTVDGGMTELFQSVSSGKAAIASAITDKGVTTDANATFTTMHNNIYSIVTFSEGTALGTITPATVLKGYLGYSKGQAIVGEHICDASEALKEADSLIPDNIAYGKKAFGSNGLVIGTHRDSSSGGATYPTYGTDTSDATATANDLLEGKVAYSKGVRLTGKLKQVEELYKYNFDTVTDNSYTVSRNVQDDDGNIYHIVGYTFSKDNKSIIRIGVRYPDDGDVQEWAVFSNAFINNEPVIKATVASDGSTVNKKYKYTMADLGITGKITGIVITAGGAYGNPNLAHILIFENFYSDILTSDRLHIYQYHLTDNRVIGKIPGESIEPYTVELNKFVTQAGYKVPDSATATTNAYTGASIAGLMSNHKFYDKAQWLSKYPIEMSNYLLGNIVPNKNPYHIFIPAVSSSYMSNVDPGEFLRGLLHLQIDLQAGQETSKIVYKNKVILTTQNSYSNRRNNKLTFSNNDKIATVALIYSNGFYKTPFVFFDENFNIITSISDLELYFNTGRNPMINDDWNVIVGGTTVSYTPVGESSSKSMLMPLLYKLTKNQDTGNYSIVELMNFRNSFMPIYYEKIYKFNSGEGLSTLTGKWFNNVLVFTIVVDRGTYNFHKYAIYLMIVQVTADGTIEKYNCITLDGGMTNNSLQSYNNNDNGMQINSTETVIEGETYNMEISFTNGLVNKSSRYHTVYVGVQEEVIAIRYKDKVYYNTQIENLTAGQPDVKKGKTFIGYMGYVEEGTMEV